MTSHKPRKYTEDDPNAEYSIAAGMEDSIRENFDVFLHRRPDFGNHHSRKDTATMVVEIPADSWKWLTKRQKMRVIERGRLPKVWVEAIKKRFGPPSPGYILQGYDHVDVKLRQQRLSDTDGGLRPTGRIRVRLKVTTDRTAHTEADCE